ncbi:MAG: hypothetical protein ABUT20_60245 [Bacteroidota bacterium]
MTETDKISFKNKLKQFCQHSIEERIAAARAIIQTAQEAANNEEKSSAGDKYETGRAMGHLQKDMHARQLTEYIKELSGLHGINTSMVYDAAVPGAFIETHAASFFIVAGLGKQIVRSKTIYFLSPYAPLAGILSNKKKGDSFYFNRENVIITEIY